MPALVWTTGESRSVTDTTQTELAPGSQRLTQKGERSYDMRRLPMRERSNPVRSASIRALEWLTAKVQLLRLIRSFEKSGAPHGAPFWPKAIRHMGIRIDTPASEIARIPAYWSCGRRANHPRAWSMAWSWPRLVNRVRSDFKILTRSLLTGIPEVEEFMIPVPFPHEDNAREPGLQMRDETMAHLKAGGVIILFPAGKVGDEPRLVGQGGRGRVEGSTHKIVKSSGATILPIYFPARTPAVPDRQPGVGDRAGKGCCCTRSAGFVRSRRAR